MAEKKGGEARDGGREGGGEKKVVKLRMVAKRRDIYGGRNRPKPDNFSVDDRKRTILPPK